MYRTLLLISVLGVAAGCPQESATQRAAATQKLDNALEQIQAASGGYVPSEKGRAGVTLAEYRQQSLQDSVEALESAAEAGAPGQRVAARRVLADVYASKARHLSRSAGGDAATLSARAAGLLSYLLAADRAQGRVTEYTTDLSAVLTDMEAKLAEATSQRQAAERRVKELDPTIADLQSRIEQLRTQSQSLRTQAQQLRGRAFDQQGDERYSALDEADKLELAGDQADFEAQRLAVDLDRQVAMQAEHQRELAAITQRVELIEQIIARTQSRQRESDQQRADAEADRAAASKGLREEFERISKAYDDLVVTTYNQALEAQIKAIEELEKAQASATGGAEQDTVRTEMLAKQMDRIYILSEFATVEGGFARTIDSLLVRADTLLPGGEADVLKATRRQIADRQGRFLEESQQAMARARELIEQLRPSAPEGSELATALSRQQRHLDHYSQMLEQAALPS